MKKFRKVLSALLFSFTLMAGSMTAFAAGDEIITTEVTASGKDITVTVNAEKDAAFTSGRFVVFYDDSKVTLENADGSNAFEVEDINTEYAENGKKGVSYACVSTEEYTNGGALLTLSFKAKDSAVGQDIVFETAVKESYNANQSLPQAGSAPVATEPIVVAVENPNPGSNNEQEEGKDSGNGAESGENHSDNGDSSKQVSGEVTSVAFNTDTDETKTDDSTAANLIAPETSDVSVVTFAGLMAVCGVAVVMLARRKKA